MVMKIKLLFLALAFGLGVFTGIAQEILPFPPTPSASTAGLTMQDSIYKKRVEPQRLPTDAPNILIILMDDVGPGQASTYGGEINTPTLSARREDGHFLQSLSFHGDVFAHARFAALTGRNHTRIGNGQICELANDLDGFSGIIPKSAATVAGGTQGLRLQHRRLGQVAQHARRADDVERAVRLLADRLWL